MQVYSPHIFPRPFSIPLIVLFFCFLCAGDNIVLRDSDIKVANELPTENHIQTTINIEQYRFQITHPPGFRLELVNSQLQGPRVISFHKDRMFVGSRSGNIYWMDPPYSKSNSIAQLDNYPHSIVVRDNYLYVAKTDGIYRAKWANQTQWIKSEDFELWVSLPDGRGHNSRTLKLGPDQNLYVSLGIRGNCSDEYLHESYPRNLRRGGVYLLDESNDPVTLKPFASGLRNPVGFDWQPETGEMYASNNGPDHLGFDQPPEYFAKLTENSFHGMPWFQFDGEKITRDSCIKSDPPLSADQVSIPVAVLPSRSAPLDIAFVPKHAKATDLFGDAIVAVHGSWGTTNKGSAKGDPASRRYPRLALVIFEDGIATRVEDFLKGFQLENGQRWARPAGVAVAPDGDIYFTSDAGLEGLFRMTKR